MHGTVAANPGSVVYLRYRKTNNEAGYCTGVVITPGHVATSAHCILGSLEFPFFGLEASSDFGLFPGMPIRIQTADIPDQQGTEPEGGDGVSCGAGARSSDLGNGFADELQHRKHLES